MPKLSQKPGVTHKLIGCEHVRYYVSIKTGEVVFGYQIGITDASGKRVSQTRMGYESPAKAQAAARVAIGLNKVQRKHHNG